jgi:hypothetical protein
MSEDFDPQHPAADDPTDDRAVDEIVGRGPAGTFAVAGVATAVVVAIYLVFYFAAYLPRGVMQ